MAGPPTHYIPPPPPPPPPGWGPGMGSKPTSGKAIASLICGLAGGVGALMCIIPGVAALVGVILGILGIIETGREGPRGGRGLAIAGTIVSALAVAGMVAFVGFFAFMARQGAEENEQHTAALLDEDQRIILERLKQYYDQNDQSLGSGGPLLAQRTVNRTTSEPHGTPPANGLLPANRETSAGSPRVTGVLELSHLVDESELKFGVYSGTGWELVITGKASATLRAKDWSNEVVREIAIQDIGRGQYAQTIP